MNRVQKIFSAFALALLLPAAARAESVYWSDGFETNVPVNWASTTSWHIAAPTAGPGTNSLGFRTHGGVRCATTQSYPNNQDTRLICTNYNGATNLLVPTADQSPRLRFWQWFNFANALGYVEIKLANSTNWQQVAANLGPTTDANGGGIWSHPSIDLTAFAGTNIQIAFHFASGGSGGNALGWFIDDVSVVTNTALVNNPENFEAGAGDWSVDAGTWEIGKPTVGPSAAHGGTNCAGTLLAGNYPNNVDSRLITPSFIVPTASSATLNFWSWFSFNNALGFVEIKSGTNNWVTLSATNISTGSIVSSSGWTNVSLNLTAYASQTVQVAFHFISGGINTAAGWYVDDVTVVAAPTLTVPSAQTIYAGQTLVVTNVATLFPTNATAFFSLVSPTNSPGATLNTNTGVFTWPTTLALASTTNTIVIAVTQTNFPAASTTNSFTVVVLNPWLPLLTVPPTQNIFAGQTLVVTNSATNNFFPTTFTYATVSAPAGVVQDSASGVLTWATSTAQSAGTNLITVTATDNNSPYLSATNTFAVIVASAPTPVVSVPSTQAIYAGEKLTVTISAANSAFPGDTYSFATNAAPTGVSINPTTGVLNWTPTAGQAPNSYSLSIKATDINHPSLIGVGGFSVLVSAGPAPKTAVTITSPRPVKLTNGFSFTFNTQPNTTWQIQASTNLLDWPTIITNTAGANGVIQFTDLSATNFPRRFYRVAYP
jgi:hypothetical protein